MKKYAIAIVVIAVAVAVLYTAAGNRGGERLGAGIPAGTEPITVAEALARASDGGDAEVVVEGEMTKKCPTSGCWFYLTDSTGDIRVDAQFAGFTVVDQKTGSNVTVYGKVVEFGDGEVELSALGAKF